MLISDLADLAQMSLSDTGTIWPEATVQEWGLEAIRDYSIHFHRVLEGSINAYDGTQEYDLNRNVIDVVLVEYPSGEDPPIYLNRLPRTDPRFWTGDRYYDIELRFTTAEGENSTIWISAEGETGESIAYTYLSAYYELSEQAGAMADAVVFGGAIEDEVVTVPDPHIPILIAFIEWRAATERLFDELQDPDRTIHLIEGMRKSVETKRQHYDEMVASALADQVRSGWVSRWHMDSRDRIY